MATSLEVQHTPEMVIPFAPTCLLRSAIISGSSAYFTDHLGQRRIMAVNDDVYHISSSITPRLASVSIGMGVPNSNVRELGTAHGTAPSIRQTTAQSLTNQRLRQGGTSHMGHMQSAWKPHGQSHGAQSPSSMPRFPVSASELVFSHL